MSFFYFKINPAPTNASVDIKTRLFISASDMVSINSFGIYWKSSKPASVVLNYRVLFAGSNNIRLYYNSGSGDVLLDTYVHSGDFDGELHVSHKGPIISISYNGVEILSTISVELVDTIGNVGVYSSNIVPISDLDYVVVKSFVVKNDVFDGALATLNATATGVFNGDYANRDGQVNAIGESTVTASGSLLGTDLTVSKYRFKANTGAENSTDWLAAENTPVGITVADGRNTVRLRFLIQNNSSLSTSLLTKLMVREVTPTSTGAWIEAHKHAHIGVVSTARSVVDLQQNYFNAYKPYYIPACDAFFSLRHGESIATIHKRASTLEGAWGDIKYTDTTTGSSFKSGGFLWTSSGKLICIFAGTIFTSCFFYRTESTDLGETWSAPTQLFALPNTSAKAPFIYINSSGFVTICARFLTDRVYVTESSDADGAVFPIYSSSFSYTISANHGSGSTTAIRYGQFLYDAVNDYTFYFTENPNVASPILYLDTDASGAWASYSSTTTGSYSTGYATLTTGSVCDSTGVYLFTVNSVAGVETIDLVVRLFNSTTLVFSTEATIQIAKNWYGSGFWTTANFSSASAEWIDDRYVNVLIRTRAPAEYAFITKHYIYDTINKTVALASGEHKEVRDETYDWVFYNPISRHASSPHCTIVSTIEEYDTFYVDTILPEVSYNASSFVKNNDDTTQQLGSGTFLASNAGVSTAFESPSRFDFSEHILPAGQEVEKEFLIATDEALPHQSKFEFKLEGHGLVFNVPILDVSDQDYLDANGALPASWSVGTMSVVTDPSGGYRLFTGAAESSSSALLTQDFIENDEYRVRMRTELNGTAYGGANGVDIIGDGPVTYDHVDWYQTYNRNMVEGAVTAGGTTTITVDSVYAPGDGYIDSLQRWYNLGYDGRESTDIYTHSSFPYLANDIPFVYARGTAILAPTATVTTGGISFIEGAIILSARALFGGVATVTGPKTGAVDLSATANIAVAGIAGKQQFGIVDATANASIAAVGISYRVQSAGFRFRHADGDETTATWLSALNTNTNSINPGTTYRIRFGIENISHLSAANSNGGALEISTDGGTWEILSLNDFDTDAVLPPPNMDTQVSSYTSAVTYELLDKKEDFMFVDSTGVWHWFYLGAETAISHLVATHRRSLDSGTTWEAASRFPGPIDGQHDIIGKEAWFLEILETANGDLYFFFQDRLFEVDTFITYATHVFSKSTNNGQSWTTPIAHGFYGHGYLQTLTNSAGDIIRVGNALNADESISRPRVIVSTNAGSSWSTYTHNNGAGMDGECTWVHAELEANDDLTIWYGVPSFTTFDDVQTAPMRLYKYVMAYPYSAWPVLVSDDDSAQLIFTSGVNSTAYSASYYRPAFMHKEPSSEYPVRRYMAWPEGATVYANRQVFHAIRQDADGTWVDVPDFNVLDTDLFTIWNDPRYPTTLNDGSLLLRSQHTFGKTYQQLGTTSADDSIGAIWFEVDADPSVLMPVYSPSVGKLYMIDNTDAALGDIVYMKEINWDSAFEDTDTTQQITSGTFDAASSGVTEYNYITNGLTIAGSTKAEYEYSFQIQPDLPTDTQICLRPSGWLDELVPACITIVSYEAHITATATINATPFVEGPRVELLAEATINAAGSFSVGANASLSATAVGSFVSKLNRDGATNITANALISGVVFIDKLAATNLVSLASTSITPQVFKNAASSLVAIASTLIGEPTIEVPARVSLLGRAFLSPAAIKGLEAAASLHGYASVAARESTQDLCISITIYESPNILTIVQDSPLNVVAIPATLTVNQPPVPDLVITQQPSLQVYLYD